MTSSSVERAYYAPHRSDLPANGEAPDRLYFGVEFCERLLPSAEDVRAARRWARERGAAFTLVTPYAGPEEARAVRALVDAAQEGDEIVANDWGVAARARERGLAVALGRLLTRQNRDPRQLPAMEGLSPEERSALARLQVHAGTFALLGELGIGRVEADLTPQGLDLRDFEGRGIAVSLHHPFGYLTTGRYCAEAAASSGLGALRGVFPCGKECQSRAHTFAEAPAPVPIHMVGNTLFYRTPLDPAPFARAPVDRLVYAPRPPM